MNEEQLRTQLIQQATNILQMSLRTTDTTAYTVEDVIASAELLLTWIKSATTPAV
jgi:hypothetical protein